MEGGEKRCMGVNIGREEEDVINVDEGGGEEWFKNADHCFLEQRGSSFESEGHDGPMEMMVWDTKSGFGSITGLNTKLPESCFEIKF